MRKHAFAGRNTQQISGVFLVLTTKILIEILGIKITVFIEKTDATDLIMKFKKSSVK